jgi:type VI secretion system protein ImpE
MAAEGPEERGAEEAVTPHEALAEGRLAEALALQERIVAAEPKDPAARRMLIDMLAFAGRLDDADDQLDCLRPNDPEWQSLDRQIRALFRAERHRRAGAREPQFVPRVEHVVERWRAIDALRRGRPRDAVTHVDRADAASPHRRGFLDGQEFEGLHDVDDRFASVLEAYRAGKYVWYAWEVLRKVSLAPAAVLLDQLYRPATITLLDGTEFSVNLPLIYPNSHEADEVFALGLETDHICPDQGPVRSVGAKLLIVSDGSEVRLSECRMIEFR